MTQTSPGRWTLPVVLTGTFVTMLDFFIVNVAMPDAQRDLHAGGSAVQLVVAGYGLTLAMLLVTGGRLGDLYGRRRMFSLGLALFTAHQRGLRAGAERHGARARQAGAGRRGRDADAADARRHQHLVQRSGALAGLRRVRPDHGRRRGARPGDRRPADRGRHRRLRLAGDLPGQPAGRRGRARCRARVRSRSPGPSTRPGWTWSASCLLSAALAALVLPLVLGREQGWPEWTVLSLVASPVLLVDWAWWERRLARRGGAPLLDVTALADRGFAAGLGVALVFCLGQASFFLVLSLYLQQGAGTQPARLRRGGRDRRGRLLRRTAHRAADRPAARAGRPWPSVRSWSQVAI